MHVAAVQLTWNKTIDQNVFDTLMYLERAKEKGCDAVLFPEANLTSYDFEYIAQLDDAMISDALKTVQQKCKALQINAIVGTISRKDKNGKRLNIAHVINRAGETSYEAAKFHLAGQEEKENCRPGDKIAFFEIDGIKCGLAICRDGRSSETFMLPAMAGAQIFFQPSNNRDPIESAWWKNESGRATQPIGPRSFIYHVCANGVGQGQDGKSLALGHSFIKDPTGLSIAAAGHYEEGMIHGVLDLSKASARYIKDSMERPSYLKTKWQEMVDLMLMHKDDAVV